MTRCEPVAEFMRRAIALSRNGFPAPNPHVGCVIVQGSEIVGEGFHDHAGGPHAEQVALDRAGARAEGADVYVTLEPCGHFGRTPPCADALVAARVGRVIVACRDPNPRAAGGVSRLEEAGIEVVTGFEEDGAAAANDLFLEAMKLRRPVVVVKAAASLDGRSALASGESKWITGEEARSLGHRLRAECGAVLVGYRTVMADDPELTARIEGVWNQPLRVVIDPDDRLTGKERVFNDKAETRHVTGRPIDLHALLRDLYASGRIGLLVEGGPRTIGTFFSERLVDRVELFVSPKLVGNGPAWLEGFETPDLRSVPSLGAVQVSAAGNDLHISGRPVWPS